MQHDDPRHYTLRLSLTGACTLRCLYCYTPCAKTAPTAPLEQAEFLGVIAAIAQHATLSKLRLTGGEPLLFQGVSDLIRRLAALLPDCELCLTTNGLDLARHAAKLKAAGLTRLTVSLDAAEPQTYQRITGHDGFSEVIRGLEAARQAGFGRIKINTVLLAQQNGAALGAQIRLAQSLGAEARFIELMPLGPAKAIFAREHLPADQALRLLAAEYPEQYDLGQDGTARRFRLCGPLGCAEIGLIRPLSAPFCGACNRLRLDADGRLYTCLRQARGTDLASPYRQSDTPRLAARIRRALREKHPLLVWPERAMQRLGG